MRNTYLLMAWIGLASVAWGVEEPPQKPASGRELPSLDELLNLPAPTADSKPAEGQNPPPASAPNQPFAAVTDGMLEAAGRLEKSDSSLGTQRVQERVLQSLDQLISQATRQKKNSKKSKQQQQDTGSKSGGKPSPSQQPAEGQAAQSSDSNSGIGQQTPQQDPPGNDPLDQRLAEWGNLPPYLRDALMEGRDDPYSALYRRITERYYKRLQEESP